MAKVRAPLLSFSAEGQIGESQVYSRWRGIPYARRYVIPANPRSTQQTAVRNVFRWLQSYWTQAGPIARAPWETAARGRPVLGVNLFTGINVQTLRNQTDLTALVGSNAANGGLPPSGINATPTADQITVNLDVGEPPPNWTLTAIVAVAVKDQDPSDLFEGWVFEATAAPDPGDIVLDELEAETLYIVSGWPVWEKPDGRTAYGASRTTTATTLAA